MTDPRQESRIAFDWIDIVLLLGVSYLVVLAFMLIGYKPPNFVFVGPLVAPLAWGAIGLRSRLWPRSRRVVLRRLTLLGLLATTLLVGGFFIGVFGAYWLTTLPHEPKPLKEREIRLHAEQLVVVESKFEIIDGARPAPDDVAIDAAGFEELLKELEKPPSEAAIQKHEARLRADATARLAEDFRFDRKQVFRVSAWMGLVAFVTLALGAWVDSKRAVVEPRA